MHPCTTTTLYPLFPIFLMFIRVVWNLPHSTYITLYILNNVFFCFFDLPFSFSLALRFFSLSSFLFCFSSWSFCFWASFSSRNLMHSTLVNAHPPLICLGAALSFSLGAGIACTRNLDIYFNCSEGFEGPGFSQLFWFRSLVSIAC